VFPCCLVFGVLSASPRLIMLGLWLFTDYITRAFNHGILWPLLGLIFLPCTAMAYAIAVNEFGGLHGWGVLVFVLGILIDMLIYGSERARKMRHEHWGPDHTHPEKQSASGSE